MLAPQGPITRDDMETRRLTAANELLNGHSQAFVARRYGVSRTTASRWQRSIVSKGLEGMRKRRATGRPSRLTADQIDSIRQIYASGALSYGFANDNWTTGRFAEVIERVFGIRYDRDHVGRLLHKFGLRARRNARPAIEMPAVAQQQEAAEMQISAAA